MRLITIRALEGQGQHIAALALQVGISAASQSQAKLYQTNKATSLQDVVDISTSTPKAKKFIEALMAAPFYDPQVIHFTIRHPESIYAAQPIEEETEPIIRPTSDVYEELWQFSRITVSLVARVFLSSLLLVYGMREDYMPLIIAGLLFLPYHHHMLSIGLGASIREWQFFRQGLYAFLLSTLLILLAGVCVGFLTEPPIKFTDFTSPPLVSFLLAIIIGMAAGFASVDDAGRRELIGLAATSHLTIYPAWFGLKIMYGFEPTDKPIEHVVIFLMNVATVTLFAAITYVIMRMHGDGIRRFVKSFNRGKE